MTEPVYIVSVVRNYDMYGRCVLDNPYCKGLKAVALDNREENLSISVRYNQFLDSCTEPAWIIFCHEDWALGCDILPLLQELDKGSLYGPIGVWIRECRNSDFLEVRGRTVDGPKDGSKAFVYRGMSLDGKVDTFDCQCLIVHNSLVREKGLRFDERLSFDLYVEDFCVSAFENYGIESRILPLECRHYSLGTIGQRFYDSLSYLREKYANAVKRHATIVGRHETFGRNSEKPIYYLHRTLGAWLRYWIKK